MKTTPHRRAYKLADLIKEEVSRLLLKGVKDPRIGMITITDVEVSNDIKRAKIFYSVVGNSSQREDTKKGLQSASGFIRSRLAHNLTLKKIPEITFSYDETLDYGEKIETIFRDLNSSSKTEC